MRLVIERGGHGGLLWAPLLSGLQACQATLPGSAMDMWGEDTGCDNWPTAHILCALRLALTFEGVGYTDEPPIRLRCAGTYCPASLYGRGPPSLRAGAAGRSLVGWPRHSKRGAICYLSQCVPLNSPALLSSSMFLTLRWFRPSSVPSAGVYISVVSFDQLCR